MAKKGQTRKKIEERRRLAVAAPVMPVDDDLDEEEEERDFEEGDGGVILGSCPVCGANHPKEKRWLRHYQGDEPYSFIPQAYLALAQDPHAHWAVIAHFGTPEETEAASPGLFTAIRDRFLTAIETWLARGWFRPDDFARFVPYLAPGPGGPPAPLLMPDLDELDRQRQASRARRRVEIENLLRQRIDEENAFRRDRNLPEEPWPVHDDGSPFSWQEVREHRRARRQDFIRGQARAPLEGALADFAREEAEEVAAGQAEDHMALGGVEPRAAKAKPEKKPKKEKILKAAKPKKESRPPESPLDELRRDVAVVRDNLQNAKDHLDNIPRLARTMQKQLNDLIREARRLPAVPELAEPDPAKPSAALIEGRAYAALDAWNRVIDLQAADAPAREVVLALNIALAALAGREVAAELPEVPPAAPSPPPTITEQILGRRLEPVKLKSPAERNYAALNAKARAAVLRAAENPSDWERQRDVVLDALQALVEGAPSKEVRTRIYEASESYGRLEAAIESGNQAAIDQAFVNLLACCPP